VNISEDKTLRTVPIDGKTSNYVKWSKRFQSLCKIKDCDQALLKDYSDNLIHDETNTLDSSDANYSEKKEIMKANRLAYSMLMLCQNDHVSLRALTYAVTTKRPSGCERTAWKNLEQLHKPKDDSTKYELVRRFNRLELRQENKNPDEWLAELESIRAQLLIDHSYNIPDSDLISHIVYNAQPRIYQTLFTLVKRDLSHKVTISIENLKRDMRPVYNHNTNSTFSHGKNIELVLSAVQSRGKPRCKKVFKGDCRICGEKGHKAADCWESDRNKYKRPSNCKSSPGGRSDKSDDKKKLHCTYCNKDGHTMDRCFRKKRNEKKDDKQDNSDLVMIAIDGSEGQTFHREISFIHKEDNDHDKALLRDKYNMSPNTFIFDSGVTSHMIYTKEGLTNVKP
jgi:hypothetical protein